MSRDSGTGQPGLLAGLVLEMATENAQCGGSAHVDISSDFRIRLRGQGVGDFAKDEIEHQPVLRTDQGHCAASCSSSSLHRSSSSSARSLAVSFNLAAPWQGATEIAGRDHRSSAPARRHRCCWRRADALAGYERRVPYDRGHVSIRDMQDASDQLLSAAMRPISSRGMKITNPAGWSTAGSAHPAGPASFVHRTSNRGRRLEPPARPRPSGSWRHTSARWSG